MNRLEPDHNPEVAAIRMDLGAARQLHPLACALLNCGDEGGLGDDDVAADREDRFRLPDD